MGRIRARKGLGQHWLIDQGRLKAIADAAGIGRDEAVVEVGPGSGLLTEHLASKTQRLIAVEIDRDLAPRLRERFRDRSNVSIIEADVLAVDPADLLALGGASPPYVVIGNLPYFIGSAIVRHFLYAPTRPRSLTVMLQAEVGRTMAAGPGEMGYLSVQVQIWAKARILFYLPPKAFRPPPKVRSALVKLDVRDQPAVPVEDMDDFLCLARAGFAAPRKQLRNSLAIGLRIEPTLTEDILAEAEIDPGLRPAALDLAAWGRLYAAYRRHLSAASIIGS